MDIRFTDKKLEKISLDETMMLAHVKSKGVQDPAKAVFRIQLALTHIDAADTMHEIPEMFRPHPLVVDLYGHYGLDITKSHRMILRPDHDDQPDFKWENTRNITRVEITQLCFDYHGKKEKKI